MFQFGFKEKVQHMDLVTWFSYIGALYLAEEFNKYYAKINKVYSHKVNAFALSEMKTIEKVLD